MEIIQEIPGRLFIHSSQLPAQQNVTWTIGHACSGLVVRFKFGKVFLHIAYLRLREGNSPADHHYYYYYFSLFPNVSIREVKVGG